MDSAQSTPQVFIPTINRPTPWWSEPKAREELIALAKQHLIESDEPVDAVYAASRSYFTNNFQKLTSLPNINRVFFAMKANNDHNLIKSVIDMNGGIECVSLNELKHVLSIEPLLSGDRILFTPNFSSKSDYMKLKSLFDTESRRSANLTQILPYVTIDNMWMIEQWDLPNLLSGFSLFIRVDAGNDGYGHHSHVSTGASSKFGCTQHDISTYFSQASENSSILALSHMIHGLHMHKGSGISDSSEWANTARQLLSFQQYFPSLSIIDLGGGIGVPYKPTDNEFDLIALSNALLPIRQEYPHISIFIEPGRFVAAASGVMLVKVNQLKSKGSYRFVGVSAGMNALIRPALYGSYHHIINLTQYNDIYLQQSNDNNNELYNYNNNIHWNNNINESIPLVANIVGTICESGDFLGKNRLVPSSTNEDDIFLIDTTGAYGRVMAQSYNMRYPGPHFMVE